MEEFIIVDPTLVKSQTFLFVNATGNVKGARSGPTATRVKSHVMHRWARTTKHAKPDCAGGGCSPQQSEVVSAPLIAAGKQRQLPGTTESFPNSTQNGRARATPHSRQGPARYDQICLNQPAEPYDMIGESSAPLGHGTTGNAQQKDYQLKHGQTSKLETCGESDASQSVLDALAGGVWQWSPRIPLAHSPSLDDAATVENLDLQADDSPNFQPLARRCSLSTLESFLQQPGAANLDLFNTFPFPLGRQDQKALHQC